METKDVLERVQGLGFKAIGPFLVADLTGQLESVFSGLQVGEHGMEEVSLGKRTESHTHPFPSFYKSSGLDVECGGVRFSLPSQALTLVLPGFDHSWVPQNGHGKVGSVDHRHEKQVVN